MGACRRAAGRDKSHVRQGTLQREDLGRHLDLGVMRFPRNCKVASVRDPVKEYREITLRSRSCKTEAFEILLPAMVRTRLSTGVVLQILTTR